MAGVLDYTPALNANLNVDDTGNTFAGVFKASTEYTSTHIQQTVLHYSTTLLVTKVLHHMMQVYSTAHMYLYKWLEQLVRIHSNQKSGLRLVTVWLLTHLLKELHLVVVVSRLTPTDTIREFKLRTLCNFNYILFSRDPSGSLFLFYKYLRID